MSPSSSSLSTFRSLTTMNTSYSVEAFSTSPSASANSTNDDTNDDDSNDSNEQSDHTIILTVGIFMLVLSLFILIFAAWIYRRSMKRFFSRCWRNFYHNGIRSFLPWCLRRQQGCSSTPLLNDIVFDPDEERNANLAESLLT
mmetsp:Transcript_1858/g.2483  ORF Transcript_1858/g.2483 Transcript_1858/m.2483 type:complete len:142 (-) Transcript_1858:963-1388(-)